MKTFLLTWNPSKWDWIDLPKLANETSLGEVVQDRWSCSSKQIKPGDRCFLAMVGSQNRGIIASGWATSLPIMGEHWNPEKAVSGEQCQFVNCEWEKLLNPKIDSPLLVSELKKILDFHWTPQNSGVQIPDDVATKLENLWARHTGKTLLASVDVDPEISAIEGELRISMVRHKRREQKLRVAKIQSTLQANGGRLKCEVPRCGFDFFETYGEVGFEFAHVHHLKPLADREAPASTKLDDLAVICANCHAMIHRGGKCRPLEGLVKAR